MLQTSWDEISISNKLKSIMMKVTKLYTQPNASRRSEIIDIRTRIGHTNLAHIHALGKHNIHLIHSFFKSIVIDIQNLILRQNYIIIKYYLNI